MASFASKIRQPSIRFRTLREKSKGTVPSARHGKHWDSIFSKARDCGDCCVYEDRFEPQTNPEDRGNWVDVIQIENEPGGDRANYPPEQELLTVLLGESEEPNASWETRALANFLSRRDDEALVAEDDQAWAWVDDREISAGRSRDYSRSFDSCDLQEILENTRFGHPSLRNVDQRMIYISKLTPSFVSCLAKTSWYHQMEALHDAIQKHVISATYLRVKIPAHGFNTYRLEFHMAHLLLRPSPPATDSTTDGSIANLSFLDLSDVDGRVVPHAIYQGHMSLVICGWSNLQWTGYAFTRDENGGKDVIESDEFKNHLATQYGFDFATPTQSAQPWDARRYWLHLVAHRSQRVLQEWQYLVRTIEEGVETWKSQDPCNSATIQTSVSSDDIKKSMDKTVQTMQLLRQLRDALSITLREYKRFIKSDGDKCYFSDNSNCSPILNSIFESSEKLADLSSRLSSLDDSCKRFATHLDCMIHVENNRLIMETNMLDQESNTYHAASNRLEERINELNEENIVLTKEMRKLKEKSIEAACASQAAATKTSRSTRVNVELVLLTTPLGIVLQYFSSEQEVLFFKRSPTTFVLATLVLMLLLRVLIVAIPHCGTFLQRIFRNPFAHNAKSQLPNRRQRDTIELEGTRNVRFQLD